ncbi:MAG: hypothetical protein ACP5HQ_08405 [Thermoprotei archaeon]
MLSTTTGALRNYRIVAHLIMSKRRLAEDFLNLSIVREFDIDKNRTKIVEYIEENFHAKEVLINEFQNGQVDLILSFDNVDYLEKAASLINRYQREIYVVPTSETLLKKTSIIDYSAKLSITKLTTLYRVTKYVNYLVFIPTKCSYGIVRIIKGSKLKLNAFEKQNMILTGVKERHDSENSEIFRLNNYLISDKGLRSEETKVHESRNASEVFNDVYCLEKVRYLTLISSVGIMARDLRVLPWPLTTFQLASNDTALYTMFVAKFKVKSVKEGKLDQTETMEVLELNGDLETSELRLELEARRLTAPESRKIIKASAVTHPSLVKDKVRPGQTYAGLLMAKVFQEIENSPAYLLHVFDDERSVDEIKLAQSEALRELEASFVDYRGLTRSLISKVLNRIRQTSGLCRPWEPDWELVEHNAEALQLYYEVYDRLTKGGLKPKSPEAGDYWTVCAC